MLPIATFLQNLQIHNDCFFPSYSQLQLFMMFGFPFNHFPQSSTLSKQSLGKCVYERFLLLNKKDSNIWVTDQLLQSHLSGFPNWRSHFRPRKKVFPKVPVNSMDFGHVSTAIRHKKSQKVVRNAKEKAVLRRGLIGRVWRHWFHAKFI